MDAPLRHLTEDDDHHEEGAADNPMLKEGVASLQEELQEFREQWQHELQAAGQQNSDSGQQRSSKSVEEEAKKLFLQGMQAEQNGHMYEAVQFYRHAMQLVPDIEFKIDFPQNRNPRERQDSESSMDGSACEEIDEDLVMHFQNIRLSNSSICEPAYEQRATHICKLPVEVLMYIFYWVVSSELDVRSLEMLSEVCRGFYLCARDENLWKAICLKIWGKNCGSSKKYGTWRRMYLDRPHLLFNGCYISRATYFRQGEQGMDQFYRPFHMVEYYRYVRFFPDGSMLMVCSPEEPSTVLPKLRTITYRFQGLLTGYYKLYSTKAVCVLKRVKLMEPVTRYKRRQPANQNDIDQTYSVEFEMVDSGRRRHCRLNWLAYSVCTLHKASGHESVAQFDLKSSAYPPLIFSRVRSYTAMSDAPLQ
ncbi:hypothetical protein C0Q70_07939 [Pomacea canaliculata]|uniref:F-box only protein 9 n=1 Tax=Pomacea canaliculata TaxID=400727 RepID=A0A2T7PGK6_POMCA|nr:F-box only protein 9-like [Pomacea canaliculata]PVD32500.1 hypothetical protein C0Q70_07939 [Pomacea canaliculata]